MGIASDALDYQPEAAQISVLSRAASWEAPVRQSSPEERKP